MGFTTRGARAAIGEREVPGTSADAAARCATLEADISVAISGSYAKDLYGMAKSAATMESHQPHPDLLGATAGEAHASPFTNVLPPDQGARRNAEFEASHENSSILPYHSERPIVEYVVTQPTDSMTRVHTAENEVGRWATRASDILHGFITGHAAQEALSLPNTPNAYSDVSVPPGTRVEVSKPISDAARQFSFEGAQPEWFSNTRKLR